jgi:hypothetical protein
MGSYRHTWKSSLAAISLALSAAFVLAAAGPNAENLNPGLGETAAGDLVADAVRAAAKADIAFVQAGILKPAALPRDLTAPPPVAPPPPGGWAGLLLAYPQERITVLTLDSGVVLSALQRSVSVLPIPHKAFLQVSGITVLFDAAAPPMKRVLSVAIAGAPLETARTCKVAMPSSLAGGYLGFFRLFNGATRQELDTTLAQALSSYLAAKPPVPRPPERLRQLAPK